MSVAEPETARAAAGRLDALAEALGGHGFATQVERAGGKLCVSVSNQDSPELSEIVSAAPEADGSWWFWWSWGDHVAPISDVKTAAFKIAYVLTPTS